MEEKVEQFLGAFESTSKLNQSSQTNNSTWHISELSDILFTDFYLKQIRFCWKYWRFSSIFNWKKSGFVWKYSSFYSKNSDFIWKYSSFYSKKSDFVWSYFICSFSLEKIRFYLKRVKYLSKLKIINNFNFWC